MVTVTQKWKQRRKEKERKSKDDVKSEFVKPLMEGDVFGNEGLAKRAHNVISCEKSITMAKGYEPIIRSQKKGISNVVYRQGIIFKKFKE